MSVEVAIERNNSPLELGKMASFGWIGAMKPGQREVPTP